MWFELPCGLTSLQFPRTPCGRIPQLSNAPYGGISSNSLVPFVEELPNSQVPLMEEFLPGLENLE